MKRKYKKSGFAISSSRRFEFPNAVRKFSFILHLAFCILHFLLSRAVLPVFNLNHINVLILQIHIRTRRHDHLSAFHSLAKI